MKPQNREVLSYLERGNTSTPAKAIAEFGIYRLGARIYDLRKAGYDIETRLVSARNRHGTIARFAEYMLRG